MDFTLKSYNAPLQALKRQGYIFITLERHKRLVPISTICMHGSPWSRYSNSLIWDKYDYKKLGIIAEPYFDLDYSRILYLTDTGRRWDGDKVNVRDKVFDNCAKSNTINHFKRTKNIIHAVEKGKLPEHIIINTHPHRWFNLGIGWLKELVFQNAKNLVKAGLIKIR